MTISITFGWWILPLIISLIGSIWLWKECKQCGGQDIFGIGAMFEGMAFIIIWSVPWGIYSILKAIFG